MLLVNDVIDLVGQTVARLGKLAVFAKTLLAFPNPPLKVCRYGHGSDCEAVPLKAWRGEILSLCDRVSTCCWCDREKESVRRWRAVSGEMLLASRLAICSSIAMLTGTGLVVTVLDVIKSGLILG